MGSLILVRHAITAASAAGRNLGQRSDLPLSDAGFDLARRLGGTLAAELAELPHDEMRLLSSPALRCGQTAAAIAAALELDESRIEVAAGPDRDRLWRVGWPQPEECRAARSRAARSLGGGPLPHQLSRR